jgi:hypothetical protein
VWGLFTLIRHELVVQILRECYDFWNLETEHGDGSACGKHVHAFPLRNDQAYALR